MQPKETFLQAWHDTLDSNWVKAGDIVNLINEQDTEQSFVEDQTTTDEFCPSFLLDKDFLVSYA